MKTKLIHPRNLKSGDVLVMETMPRDMARDGNPRQFPVLSINKYRSGFTGSLCYQVTFSDDMHPLGQSSTSFVGAFNNYPQEKACVLA